MPDSGYHMSPDEFRVRGRAVVDWIADYLAHLEDRPVLSEVEPGEIRSLLSASPPEQGEAFDEMLRDVERAVMPGITHWQSPNFFAFFPANASGPAILGDLLSSGLGVQGMLWATSPACTELETHVLDWLIDLLALPKRFLSSSSGGGVIQDTASSATLCALIAARERATGGRSNSSGAKGDLIAYTSAQAHSSVEKAVRIAGLGSESLRLVETDDRLAMRPDALRRSIEDDLARGAVPTFVAATVGSTSTMAVDPVDEIGRICNEHNVWLHVDAAMAGTAALCPEFRWIHDGLETADSYCFNPHKWMFTNFDCDAFFVADRGALIRSLSILPEYLRNPATESGAVIDYRDWQIPLGRRFRALKMWFVIRHYGRVGLQHHVREHVRLAQEFAAAVGDDERFVLHRPQNLNLVCFRHRDGNDATARVLEAVNSGGFYITHTKIGDDTVLRMSIGGTATERRHVERAWSLIAGAADG